MRKQLKKWRGELFAFSAVDGKTDWQNGIVGRICGKFLELKLPVDGGALIFEEEPDGIYGDCLTAGCTRAAFADACTLLIDGPFIPAGIPAFYELRIQGSRAVLAPQTRFDAQWFEADFDAVFASRKKCPFFEQ